jgi:transcriptional regulator with PAS, ATPase and Fis domain
LLESKLSGYVNGSVTGVYRNNPGNLQMALHGTLFLSEMGEMSLRMQAPLLRFLENGGIQAVGSNGCAGTADVRIAATNPNLPQLIAAGQFRDRLRVLHLEVPPLRERQDDIRPLVARFIERTGRYVSTNAPRLADRRNEVQV